MRPWGIKSNLAELTAPVEAALTTLLADRAVERLWARDHTFFRPDPTEIANRLSWLDCPTNMRPRLAELEALAKSVKEEKIKSVLLLGMGGSSLAPEVFAKVFGAKRGWPRLAVLDSTDPAAVEARLKAHPPQTSLYVVASKSGTTIEPLSFMNFFLGRAEAALGGKAGRRFVAITDPGSFLAGQATRLGFRAAVLNDPDIGGRYSALSCFGLLPAALMGVKIAKLLDRATEAAAQCQKPGRQNPGLMLGAVMGAAALSGRDKLTVITSPTLAPLGDWIEQLVAESTGKEGRGVVPVVGEPVGPPAVYGPDRLFVYIRRRDDRTHDVAVDGLEKAGQPVLRQEVDDLHDLGGQFLIWEFATALAGRVLGINPFDQPDVEAAKVLARQMMSEYQAKGALPAEKPFLTTGSLSLSGDIAASGVDQAVTALMARRRPGAYLSLMAYLPPEPETEMILRGLRAWLRDKHGLAVTVGFGPRFLHSTGQLHKGDGGNGLFIQFTADDPADLPIPAEPGARHSVMTFGVLKAAQAMGDAAALRKAGRPVLRVHLGAHPASGLAEFWDAMR